MLASVRNASKAGTLEDALKKALVEWTTPAEKDTRTHVRAGNREGVHWETEIPVTDPGIPPGGHRGPPGR